MKKDKFSYNIVSEIATIGTRENMAKEVNFISWNGTPPVIDIRYWNSDHSEMSSGITLTQSELTALINGLKAWSKDMEATR